MMNSILIKKVRSAICEILSEAPEEEKKPGKPKKSKKKGAPGEISTKGAFGSGGRSKRFVTEAGARAESDSEGLMKDLGIQGAAGGNDLDQVLSIFNTAIHSNVVMSDAYVGARRGKDTPTDQQEQIDVVSVKTGKLDKKNGVRFLAHTLKAAKNAGFINLTGGVQFAQSGDSIILYSF